VPDQHVVFRVVNERCTPIIGAVALLPNVPIWVADRRRPW
jgi:hypothetical protein